MRRVTLKASIFATAGLTGALLASAAQADDTTTVTMTFTGNGCVGCVISPQAVLEGASLTDPDSVYPNASTNESANYRVGADNKITFQVPTSRTKGMSFVIDNPAYDDPKHITDFQTLIAVQYAGYSPGDWVNVGQAKRSKGASPCWSGTTEGEVALTVNVRKQTADGLPVDGAKKIKKVDIPLAWVVPTHQAYDGFTGGAGGVVGAQDIYPCGPAATR